jgi:response regulator RpfG family c-di-GMP phosphodiesterase
MKIKIFVVDDQVDMRLLMYRILTREGYEVQTDATGEITRLKVIEKADLILLDVNLENEDGRELCRELKQSAATKNIPIILISAVPDLSET